MSTTPPSLPPVVVTQADREAAAKAAMERGLVNRGDLTAIMAGDWDDWPLVSSRLLSSSPDFVPLPSGHLRDIFVTTSSVLPRCFRFFSDSKALALEDLPL